MLNLEKMSKRLDEALEAETSESLTAWILNERSMLTKNERIELDWLHVRRKSRDEFFPLEDLNRLNYLNMKQYHNFCKNPRCYGYKGTDKELSCPKCGSELFKTA